MSNATPTKAQKIKAAKDALRPHMREIRTAEAVLADLYRAASPHIANLIKVKGHPGPHKIRLDSETVLQVTFRKTGEHIPEGESKAIPTYGMKIVDEDEDEDEAT